MRLSSMADYAVVTMCAAARHCGFARVSASDLAQETGLPLPTVQKLVSTLSKAGLLKSVRGAGGGIQLSRPAAAITLADIVEAVEGPIALTSCVEEGRHDCALEASCSVRPHWAVVNKAMRGALAGISLSQLSSPRVPAKVGTAGRDFSTSLEANGAIL
jgi:FeS assembly SUF system regulator